MKANGLCRIGRDVEIRRTPKGEAVANLSLAFTYGRKGDDGKKPTQWVEASLWGARAESLAPYLNKGSQVVAYLEDVCLQTFRKADGTESTKMVARVSDLELIGGMQSTPAQVPAPRPAPKSAPSSGFDDMEDDVPF